MGLCLTLRTTKIHRHHIILSLCFGYFTMLLLILLYVFHNGAHKALGMLRSKYNARLHFGLRHTRHNTYKI